MRTHDVAVVGLGALGAATLHRLALAGARVVGLEQHEPGHDRGSSHGGSRAIRRALFEHAGYLPIVDRALELWRELEGSTPRQVFDERVGLVLAGPPAGELVTGTRRVAAERSLPIESVAPDEARRRFPTLSIPEELDVLFDPDGGILRPEEAVRAQVAAALELGAEVRSSTSVGGWSREGRDHRIDTSAGPVVARRLVIAAGAWSKSLLPGLPPLELRRKLLFWHRPLVAEPWRLGAAPIFAFELPRGVVYGFPALDERGVKVAEHSGGDAFESPPPDPVLRPGDDGGVRGAVTEVLRGLEPVASHHVACTYTMSPDGHPLVGPLPGEPGVLVAAGFSGHGFKHSIALGEALAELALEGSCRLPLELLSPARFGA